MKKKIRKILDDYHKSMTNDSILSIFFDYGIVIFNRS